jgi:hypothetical protein
MPEMSLAKIQTGRLHAPSREVRSPPKRGKKVYLLTSAQNNTGLHDAAWRNLLALAAHDKAELLVSRFTYNIPSAAKGEKKSSRERTGDSQAEWWDSRLEPYFADSRIEIAPHLVWCGDLQILPTAENPITGYESLTGRASSILPHSTFAVESIASPKGRGTKMIWTTGTVTLRNYIQKKAGQKAEFNHGYGALIVEVCRDGTWFVRQLNADSEGVIYDLDRKVSGGRVTYGHRPEALVCGDIHVRQLEPAMRRLLWGAGGMVDALRPHRQVLHDVLDFRSQNHHDRKDPWKTYEKHVARGLDVAGEIDELGVFLEAAARPWCETVIVAANHDEAYMRWLRETTPAEDPLNARFWLQSNLAAYDAMRAGDKAFYPVQWAVEHRTGKIRRAKWLRRDEEYIVCPDAGGGIDLGMHGDKGANGAKGSLKTFAKSGRKTITGDSHTPGQRHGAMSVGVMGSLDQGYNVGLSSWSHTNALVYPNGKRTLFSIWNGRFRA